MNVVDSIPVGRIAYLPTKVGDGYTWGGGIVVSFGDTAIELGGPDPTRGYEPKAVALANLLASSPQLYAALKLVRRIWAADDMCEESRAVDCAIAAAEGRS